MEHFCIFEHISIYIFISLLINVFSILLFIPFIFLLISEVYFNINYVASVKIIVESEKLIYANNMYVTSIGIANFVGYITGAYVYKLMCFRDILIIIIILFIASLIFWIKAKIPEMHGTSSKDTIKFSEIIRYLKKEKNMLYLIILYDIGVLLTISLTTPAYVPYSFNVLHMSELLYGFYSGISILFLSIISVVMYFFIHSKKTEEYTYVSLILEGVIIIFISMIPTLFINNFHRIFLFFLLTIIISVPSVLELSSFSTIFQKYTPVQILGRFYSVRSLLRGIINTTGLLFAGYLIESLGPIPIIFFSGLITLLMAIPTKILIGKI